MPHPSPRALIIDDDENFRALARRFLEAVPFEVTESADGAEGIALANANLDVICLDLGLPDAEGLDVLASLRARVPDVPVVVLTADASVDSVVQAMQAGAFDYMSKPIDQTRLSTVCVNASERARLARRVAQLERDQGQQMIGDSSAMAALRDQIARVAASEVTVALHGESGSGKELVARALHQASPRAAGPFVAINCAAIAESLVESEPFGHERGAFTGAQQRRIGRFEQADRGSLFLDEVAELDLSLQAKLLRVLQERTFNRLGSDKDLKSDFGLIVATHKDLGEEVEAGRFREDLYYRVAVFELDVPPLRDRLDDIPLLVRFFLGRVPGRGDEPLLSVARETMDLLLSHRWPGNVRELQNVVHHASVIARDGVVRPADLPRRLLKSVDYQPPAAERLTASPPAADAIAPATAADAPGSLPAVSLEALERMAIEQAIERHDGNVSAAIRELGIGRTTLYRKPKHYGLRA
jgi:DNA-binding NtrC family response regulator